MSKYLMSMIISVIAFVSILITPALSAERVYDNGSVWYVSYVKTKPGKYNDYLADLNNVWRKYIEAQMKDGDILSYKIFYVAARGKDDSDLVLMVEYKNWATFDRGNEYFEAMAKKIQGSVDKTTQANIDREALRTLNGNAILQEVKFIK